MAGGDGLLSGSSLHVFGERWLRNWGGPDLSSRPADAGVHGEPSGRRKLLFICQVLPYPPDGGVLIRSYHTLRILSEVFDVTGVFFIRAGVRSTAQSVEGAAHALGKLAEIRCFPIPQEVSRARWGWDHIRSVASLGVYTRFVYASAPAHRYVASLLAGRPFDMAHLDSLDLSSFLPLLRGIPVAVAHHNIESELLRRRARIERSPLRGRYLRLQAALMRREEATWAPRVALNVTVSDHDAATLSAIAPQARISVFPNGVDTDMFRPSPSDPEPGSIVFVGGATWFPNRDALEYFLGEILPLIRARRPDAAVTWVGRLLEGDRERLQNIRGVNFTGYVDDIRPAVLDAACYVVPLRVGGGTRLKILDAWAMGKAVVSTPEGCEGLTAEDGTNILIRATPAAFADAVCQVLDDRLLARRLGAAARHTAETLYGWRTIGTGMQDRYLRLTSPPEPA
jgi:glycosyltransferase involved in cell wall biosynthesis